MISIPEIVEEIVKKESFISDAITEDLINLSALARKIQPQIEKKLFKNVSESSILMALKRLSPSLKARVKKNSIQSFFKDIIVRSNLIEYAFVNNEETLSKATHLIHKVSEERDSFITISRGVTESSIIVNKLFEGILEESFRGEKLILKLKDLSAITLKLSDNNIDMPGIHYSVLKILAWENINIREIVSTYTELTIIMDDSLVDQAFVVLRKFISH